MTSRPMIDGIRPANPDFDPLEGTTPADYPFLGQQAPERPPLPPSSDMEGWRPTPPANRFGAPDPVSTAPMRGQAQSVFVQAVVTRYMQLTGQFGTRGGIPLEPMPVPQLPVEGSNWGNEVGLPQLPFNEQVGPGWNPANPGGVLEPGSEPPIKQPF